VVPEGAAQTDGPRCRTILWMQARPVSGHTATEAVLRRGLRGAAPAETRNRRFHALCDRKYRPDVLWQAWGEVRRRGGSGKANGETIVEEVFRGPEGFQMHTSAMSSCGRSG
jgi:hypothetical protein